jgi:hypothetical protein
MIQTVFTSFKCVVTSLWRHGTASGPNWPRRRLRLTRTSRAGPQPALPFLHGHPAPLPVHHTPYNTGHQDAWIPSGGIRGFGAKRHAGHKSAGQAKEGGRSLDLLLYFNIKTQKVIVGFPLREFGLRLSGKMESDLARVPLSETLRVHAHPHGRLDL